MTDDYCNACGMALDPARRRNYDRCLSCKRPLTDVT